MTRGALHPAAGKIAGWRTVLSGSGSGRSTRIRSNEHAEPAGSAAADRDHHRRGDGGAAPRRGAPAQCSCHAVLYDCCPDRLRGVLDAGATRIGLHAGGGAAGSVAAMIDHTLLKPDATRADIEKLCREAARVPLRDRLRQPDLGRAGGAAAARAAASASARSSASRWAPRPPTSSTTRRAARSSTAPPRSTW